ncbi:slc-25A42 [Pristionchus pacificus]|uniref:Mitochondrial carrier protein n=1 Tax=Pristionchus pacificus TaxID=54126 RepID=A0A2A6CD28_PRIPA|nr:slc-25A42 [Pristionchus pacificus]|eukprot:PDM75943.1 mitochondrial carrier protein [Pristionchus pacificus]
MHEDSKKAPCVLAALSAGAISGALAKTTIAPLDRTKINFQVSRTRRYSFKAALKFIRATYQTDGFLALYRGNSATLARVVPYAAFQFAAHERFKYILSVDKGKKTPGKRYIAGSLAGFVATSLTYPLDTAKARLSISKKSEYSGLVDVIVKSYRIDGPLALYRGIYSTLAGVVPYAGSSFYTFETLKLLYTEEFGRSPSAPMIMLFGATAGLIGQSCSYPLDIVRRRMQTGRAPAGMGLLALLSHIAREEGIRALYKGLSMNWLKGPISVGVSFTTYNFSFPYLSSFSQCH